MEKGTALVKVRKDSPGVIIPPPIIYALFFVGGIGLNKIVPIHLQAWNPWSRFAGSSLIVLSFVYLLPSLWKFLRTHNTLITIRPANSLETNGIYGWTRNPMYLALLILYTGIAFLVQNYWGIVLSPLVLLVIQEYVIVREEKYLERAFAQDYLNYKKSVRRWV